MVPAEAAGGASPLPSHITPARVGAMWFCVGSVVGPVIGFTSRGVTMNISSLWSFWNSVDRNSAPMTGTSPRPGNLSSDEVRLFLIRPATMKLCPSRSCTVVSTRLVVMEGRIAVAPIDGGEGGARLLELGGLETLQVDARAVQHRGRELQAGAKLLLPPG